jgi:hypothetical protein
MNIGHATTRLRYNSWRLFGINSKLEVRDPSMQGMEKGLPGEVQSTAEH